MGYVQSNSNAAGAGGAVAYTTANLTAGNLLVSVIRCNKSGFTSFACSDSLNGAWTVAFTNTAGSIVLGFAYRLNSAGGSKPTVTWTGFTAGGSVCIGEYSGVDTFRIASAGATATSTAVASDAITSTNGDLLIGFEGQAFFPSSITATNSYILRQGSTNLGTACLSSFQDKTSGGGSVTSTDTLGTAQTWTAGIAAFFKSQASNSLMLVGCGT